MIHNAVIDEMLRRRSVRSFKGNQIKPEELETVLEAGKWAASGKGAQSPRFVAIQNKADRDELSSLNAAVMGKDIDPFYG
ncbi:MAG: nitroreductase family protein, partial [Sphaerochaetaceae bacterium]|nr:nitroreductase family protein [Sphaerochaetaceae bacterium]